MLGGVNLRMTFTQVMITVKLLDPPEKSLRQDTRRLEPDPCVGHSLKICQRIASLPLDLADASIAEAAERSGFSHLSIDQDVGIDRQAKGQTLRNLLR